jgi:WD40 repeat protein
MASADLAGVVKLWQANPGGWACTRTITVARPVGAKVWLGGYSLIRVALSPDGQSLVTYSAPQRTAALWNCADGTCTTCLTLPGSGELYGLAWGPDGKLLAAAYNSEQDHDHRVLVWEVAQAALRHSIVSDVGLVMEVLFSSRGNYLAYAGAEGGALLVAPKFMRLSFVRFGAGVSVHFSPDDRLVAFADWKFGSVRLWEVATNREVAVLRFPWPRAVRFSKDGPILVAAGEGEGVRNWKLAAAHERLTLGTHPGGSPSVAFSPDGKLLASAGHDRAVRVWDPATGRVLRELTSFRGGVEAVAFSPDSSLLAAADLGGGIRFWHLPSGRELPAPKHPLGPEIRACAFSPNGRYFAAGGQGGLVLWKVVANPGDRRPDSPWSWSKLPGRRSC